MAFTMIYHKRNMDNIAKLADNTKLKTLQWYKYCIDKQVQVLVYETIRTKAQQAENVRKGASKTMQSYHLVGQAFDFVFVDQKGNALWNKSEYKKRLHVINYAKSIGFVSGYDWGWDAPHMQYEHSGYGKDTFKGNVNVYTYLNSMSNNKDSEELTLSQYNELKKIIDAQNAKIKELEKELSNKMDILSEREVGKSHKEAWTWAEKNDILNGKNPESYVTREQASTLLKRLFDKLNK